MSKPAPRRILFAALATFVSLCTLPASAISFQPVSADELKMTVESKLPGAAAVILYRQVDRDDNGFTSHEDNYVRLKILKEEGRKYANVEIPYDTASSDVVHLHARSIRPDGTISNFEGKAFTQTIVKAKGVKYQAKTLTIPDVQVGSIIEYYYTIDLAENMLFNSRWVVSQDLFTEKAKFTLKRYTHGGDFGIRWTWQGLPEGVGPKRVNDSLITLEVENIPALQIEDYMPPQTEVQARVDFIYEFSSEMQSDKDKYWKQVGRRRNGSLENYVNKRSQMAGAVSQIVSPTDTPDAKLRKIYERVQKLRNTTFEQEKTEEEKKRAKEKELNNIDDVWKRGYGDSVDLNWLFLGLVRAAGFEAYGCWVADRHNYFFNPNTMQSSKLDESVVLVKVDGKDLFFAPGKAFTPFGMLPWYETGVMGLKLDKDGGSWIQTPLPKAAESTIERTAALKLTDSGDLEGTLKVKYTGSEATKRRVEERHADAVARKKYLEDDVKSDIPVGIEIDLTNSPDWTSSAPSLVAEFTVRVPGWASGSGKRVMLPAGLFTAAEKHVFDNAQRVQNIYMEHPVQKVDDFTVELPDGWKITSLPRPHSGIQPLVGYESQVVNENGKLHFKRNVRFDFLAIAQKYYSALRGFYSEIKSADEDQVLLQPGMTLQGN